MKASEISAKIKELTALIEGADPTTLSEIKTALSRLYANLEYLIGIVEQRKPALWLAIKYPQEGEKLSDKETALRYDMTQDGQDEIELTHLRKGLEKILSALNQQIAVKRDEAKNIM